VVDDDVIVEQVAFMYDAAENVILTTTVGGITMRRTLRRES